MFIQVLSLFGAAFILVGYVGVQFRWLDAQRISYNLVNTLGAALLAYVAWHPFSGGFFLLESTWTIVSLIALGKALRVAASS